MSNIAHITNNSRSNSIDGREMGDDSSIYVTPKLETPYVTPSSTPRLIHCRLNPVKTIRQHIPLKMNFTQETQSSTSDPAAAPSKMHEIKPMNTKKIKCVIQTNPSYDDGHGDQALMTNITQSVQNSDALRNNFIDIRCNAEGDGRCGKGCDVINENDQQTSVLESVATVENEIKLMDKFVKSSIERLQKSCDIKTNSDGCDIDIISTENNCDHNNKDGKTKIDKISKFNPNCKSSSVQEDNLLAGHKCEKKKFYDPEDIRKYMMKKKSERQAKEREERSKKETEAMAFKKKTEASKMLLTKTRIPVPRNHRTNECEIKNKWKGPRKARSLSDCSKNVGDSNVNKKGYSNKYELGHRRYSKDLPQNYHQSNNEPENHEKMKENEPVITKECDEAIPQISDIGKLFEKDFHNENIQGSKNHSELVQGVQQLNKRDSCKTIFTEISSTENDKISRDNFVPFPQELDVLKSKNPYNFLNILKGKVNLVKRSVDLNKEVSDDKMLAEVLSSSFKKQDHYMDDDNQFLDDIIKRRLKLGNSAPLTMKLNDLKKNEEHENIKPIEKFDDFVPLKSNQTFCIWPPKKADKTYTILNEVDKPSITNINDKSLSLDISGIKSLSPIDKKHDELHQKNELSAGEIDTLQDKLNNIPKSNSDQILTLESLQDHNISLSLPKSLIKKDEENYDFSRNNLSMDVRMLLENESTFNKGIVKGADTSSVISKINERGSTCGIQNLTFNESSVHSSDDLTNLSTTAVFSDIFDQMIKSEDEKLCQILKKIRQQEEALNKYLKTEVFVLELKKNVYRENKEEDKIKAIKKRQRAILLKITKNIQELEKMKKSVTETVERRKTEILRQKNAFKEKKELMKQKVSSPAKKKQTDNKMILISKQTNTLFISSSNSTSVLLNNDDNGFQETSEKENDRSFTMNEDILNKKFDDNFAMRDIATSPIHFNQRTSTNSNENNNSSLSISHEKSENTTKIKIKRPLSPISLPSTRKISQMRRLSSGSDITFASFNDTTTDQSDVELRISALQEQLRQRKLEVERLRREEKQLRKERLRAKEQSLIKQLEAYDQYIQKVTKMLSEDRSLIEIAKPQIKHTSKRPSFIEPPEKKIKHSDFNEPFTLSEHDERKSLLKNKIYDDADAENTEDSEKHLKKADSGILIESEITELSENVEINKSKSESEIPSSVKSESVVGKEESEGKNETSGKSIDNFLKLINDIQSEVVSMSEQVYSSDFVEDIPEDIPDNKSEISENITNCNTSISIEEILSDHQSNSDVEVRPTSSEDILEKDVSNVAIFEKQSSPSNVPTVEEIGETKIENSNSSDIFIVKNISDIESQLSDQQHSLNTSPEKFSNLEDGSRQYLVSEDHRVGNSSKNTLSEPSVAEELQNFNSQQIDEISPIEEMKASTLSKNISSEDFLINEIKSIISLETPQTELGENSDLVNFSTIEHTSDVGTATNHEFVKYESEGSCVADVDEPVRTLEDIRTVINGLEYSPHLYNNSTSEDFISEEAQKNFDEVLKNVESYFSMKISSVNEDDIKASHDIDKDTMIEKIEAAQNSPTNDKAPVKIGQVELGFEETDVSESLEYDTTSTENSNKKYNIQEAFSENHEHDQKLDAEESDKYGQKISTSLKFSRSNQKNDNDELSVEEDRSVEEFLEDYSIPNLGLTTFIVNEDSDLQISQGEEIKTQTPSPVKSLSEILTDSADKVDNKSFDPKINIDQTPFLEALRRERETLFGQKEPLENFTAELIDKLAKESYSSTLNEITKNIDAESDDKVKVSGTTTEKSRSETNIKVEENLPKHKTDNDWLEKEFNFNNERLREAEELRLQQIRIEQEIEELQAQQHIPPYLYLREIPNKPPPPYTPPSEHTSVKIPNNESELQTIIDPAIQYVCNALKKGIGIDEIKQLPEYTPNGKSNAEITAFKKFIFDLTKEVAKNILENSKTKTCLPWENLSRCKPKLPPRKENLPELVKNEILVLFGFKSKINKEKLIIQWSRKKRNDFVDDLLIKELQEEEAEWTNYEEDENIIKNHITENLLDDLIQDTVFNLQNAFDTKNKFANE